MTKKRNRLLAAGLCFACFLLLSITVFSIRSSNSAPNLGSISGRVTNVAAVGIQNIGVNVYDLHLNWLGADGTDAKGNYTVENLPGGDLKVFFSGEEQNYLSKWYDDKHSFAVADTVTVAIGSTTPNINAQLIVGGRISGRVTDTSAVGIRDVLVLVNDLNHKQISVVRTDAGGNYIVSALPAGNLKICFDRNNQNYLSEWYNDKDSFVTADSVAVTAGSTTAKINVQLAAGGQISGKVTNASGAGIKNIWVFINDLHNNMMGSDDTDASGNYTISGLPAGNFKVEFPKSSQNYLPEWYNDKSSFVTANKVPVTVGSTTHNISAQLAVGGIISGQVTNTAAVGIENIGVNIFCLEGGDRQYDMERGARLSDTNTDASGNYMISGLPAGNFKVKFSNNGQNYLSEWYKDKSSFVTANTVAVITGAITSNINAQLIADGQISGRVTNTSDVGIQNIRVEVYDLNNKQMNYAHTDINGNYKVSSLPAGNLKVFFNRNKQNYLSEWYNDKASFETTDSVVVTVGSTTPDINAQLSADGRISGRVTDISATGIKNIWIYVNDLNNGTVGSANTDASGNYTISGLPAGNLKVFFNRNDQNYLSEWYNNKSSFETADIVAVTVGGTMPGINAQLAAGSQISGRVTNAAAAGIQNICIGVYDLNNKKLSYAHTDVSGNYTVSGLPAGNLKIFFDRNSQNYLSEWYNNKSSFKTADTVAVIAGATTSNIKAQLTADGQISGRVTNASKVGIQNIEVYIYNLDNDHMGSVDTDASGNYMVTGLPDGNYKVEFTNNGQNYVTEWYNNKSSFKTANMVAVTIGSTTPNVNAQLIAGGQISGRVTDAAAVGIKNIWVGIHDLNNDILSSAYTDASGNYMVLGLPSGNFKVKFYNDGQNYLSEWYNDKSSFETANTVAVKAGANTPNIDAQLVVGGQISGRVTNTANVGIKHIAVYVRDLNNHIIGSDYTDVSGNYIVSGLPGGNLKVFFDRSGQNYLSEWYNDKSSFGTANTVAVTIGSTTSDINGQLVIGGSSK